MRQPLHHIINSTLRCKIEFNQSINQRCVMQAETFKQHMSSSLGLGCVYLTICVRNRSNIYGNYSDHLPPPWGHKTHTQRTLSLFYCLVNFYSSILKACAYAIRIRIRVRIPVIRTCVFLIEFVFGKCVIYALCLRSVTSKFAWSRCI